MKKKQRMIVSVNYSGDKKQLKGSSYFDRSPVIYIYKSSCRLIQQRTVDASSVTVLKDLPEELLFILLQNGIYILADSLNEPR
ncbi:MAG: hypothetical protein ABI772_02445 [Bacteroidota bacterium]